MNGQLASKLKDITATLGTNEITGEYKNYDYTIDSKLTVEIGGKTGGVKPTGDAEILTKGYMFEGDGTVEIKVTASITEGQITGIEAPDGVTLKTDTSTTEKVYTVNKNGAYVFKLTSDSGKTKNITANVENILGAPQITISEVTGNSFKINVENNYPEGAITEYKYSVGGTVKQQGTTDKSYTVTGLSEETEYSNIKVIAYINSTSKESNTEKVTTIMKDGIAYTWDEIAEMAKVISNDRSITDDTETATVNGKTLKVGQMKKLDEKKVRILGFNHDELAEPATAYGSSTATGKAGISFEYVDLIDVSGTGAGTTTAQMNSTATNSGGWGTCKLRGTLNGIVYDSLSIKDKIKAVNKKYIADRTSDTESTCSDRLWLLSCGEIWNSGYNGGNTRGYSRNTEGNQYKYYKLGTQVYNSNSDYTKKPEVSAWWLRSPRYDYSGSFCDVGSGGYCGNNDARRSLGVTPGFSI